MTSTNQFGLPLIAAAQAQKHVTVNEALARLDAVAQLRLASVSDTVPPVNVADGVAYGVPAGAVNAWDTHAGEVAIFANGGWVFATPKIGWRAWVVDQGRHAVFIAGIWRPDVVAVSPKNAQTLDYIIEFDHAITAGSNNLTTGMIEDSMLVWGVSARVLSSITGTGLTGFDLGLSGAGARFGGNNPLSAGTLVNGITVKPQAYWGGTPLKLTAVGGTFSGGLVRLSIHGRKLVPPGV